MPAHTKFEVDASTGLISLIAALNYEAATSHDLVVTVTDNGTPAKSTSTTVSVTVTDINDNTPICAPMVFQKTFRYC